MLTNVLIISALILGVIVYLIYWLLRPQNDNVNSGSLDFSKYNLEEMKAFIVEEMNKLTGTNLYDLALNEEDMIRLQNQRTELKSALKGCRTGNIYDKIYVKSIMFDIFIRQYKLTETNINHVIPFEDPDSLNIQDKFEILLYRLKQQHKHQALSFMIRNYGLDRLRTTTGDMRDAMYEVSEADILAIYPKVVNSSLSLHEKLEVIVQRIYQQVYGHGVIDEIRDQQIEGVSGGVSGLPPGLVTLEDEERYLENMRHSKTQSYDSIWVMDQGKSFYFSFLTFGSHFELKRICQNIYRHNMPGMLTEDNGFIVNELADGSRINVMRPPYSESWAFFNRKFNVKYTSFEHYLKPSDRDVKNWELPAQLISYLMRGSRTTVVNGPQAVGKTTLLMAMLGEIYSWLPIRILEMSFELHARKLYPKANILSVRPTGSISNQMAMDNLKKTDGKINVIGEAATDEQVIAAIQAKQTNLFSLLSYHAQSMEDLILGLRNSLLKTGVYRDEFTAEIDVVRFVDFSIQLSSTVDGFRFLQISECVPIRYKAEYDKRDIRHAFMDFFERMTDRKTFEERVIVSFENGRYVAKEKISDATKEKMFRHMLPEDQQAFQQFEAQFWSETEEAA